MYYHEGVSNDESVLFRTLVMLHNCCIIINTILPTPLDPSSLSHTQQLAATALDSEERVRARSRLPTYAKYLREVGPATPVVAGLVTGDSEGSLTQAYGGTGQGGQSISVPIYEAVGRVGGGGERDWDGCCCAGVRRDNVLAYWFELRSSVGNMHVCVCV